MKVEDIILAMDSNSKPVITPEEDQALINYIYDHGIEKCYSYTDMGNQLKAVFWA